MKRPLVTIFCVIFLLFFSCKTSGQTSGKSNAENSDTVRISSFNIQIFGVSKMSKSEVVTILTGIASRSDITAVQEVRSAVADPVETFMGLLGENYASVLGPREGRSSSKEQYWVIYDRRKFTVLGTETYPDAEDKFERNPQGVYFRSRDGVFDFILINNHLKPGDAAREIAALPEAAAWFRELWGDPDILILGDFNADGSYYDETLLAETFPENEYAIIITNDLDTTVAPSDNTYDRFIITNSARRRLHRQLRGYSF